MTDYDQSLRDYLKGLNERRPASSLTDDDVDDINDLVGDPSACWDALTLARLRVSALALVTEVRENRRRHRRRKVG